MAGGMAASKRGGRGRGRGSARRGRLSEINVTPFVDVMLVLLIVFMVAAPMMTVGVPVDLPKSAASELTGQVKPVTVSVKADGKIFLQEAEVTREQLVPKLQALVPAPAETSIQVRGDTAASYGIINQILGDLNKSGFKKFALLSEQQ